MELCFGFSTNFQSLMEGEGGKENVSSLSAILKKIKPTREPRFLSADVSGRLNKSTSKKITRRGSGVCQCECVCGAAYE